jgi:hypothetical protein
MQNQETHRQIAKMALVASLAMLVSQCMLGCNPDEKPSKMVEMRSQMEKQKKMQGHTAPATQPPAATGQ